MNASFFKIVYKLFKLKVFFVQIVIDLHIFYLLLNHCYSLTVSFPFIQILTLCNKFVTEYSKVGSRFQKLALKKKKKTELYIIEHVSMSF